MKVDIYIRERSGGREIRIPLLPEQIKIKSGEAAFASYDIMNVGETAVPTGVGLSGYSWESEFPGKYRTDSSMMRGSWKDPASYHSILEDWKRNGTPLNLLVTGFPINKDVFIQEYTATATGAFGDIAYEISFLEDRNITMSKPSSTTSSTGSTTKRSSQKTTSYTIKKGDTLWAISQKHLGSGAKWETIYNANKAIIEQTAKKRGMNSSNHGWWIFPGVTLTIPQ